MAVGAKTFSWTKRIDGWALFVFCAGTSFLFGFGQQRALGLLLIFAFFAANALRFGTTLKKMSPVPPELWLYTAWVLWAVTTGFFVAVDLAMFWTGIRVLLQVFVLVWFAYAILSNQKESSVDVVFLGILIGGLIQIGIVASGVGGLAGAMTAEERALGTMSNPNGLGFLMVWSVICAVVFWRATKNLSWLWRAFILAVIPLAVFVMLATGSRKSTLAMGILIFLWVVFGPRPAKGIRNFIVSAVLGGFLLFGFVEYLPDFMEETPAGRRFQQFFESGEGDVFKAVEEQSRYDMYVDGLKIFGENPIFGVGVNNFGQYFRTGQYSHSNYIEPLATTGLLGFLLFQAFYLFPLFRIRRLLKSPLVKDESIRYRLRVYAMGLVSIFVIGAGAPFYTSSHVYLLLTAISLSTWRIQREYLLKKVYVPYGSSNIAPAMNRAGVV